MTLTPEKEMETSLGIYKAYLEDLGRIGGRHETARAFYLSVISALFAFLALAQPTGALSGIRGGVQVLVGLVGVLISGAWFFHMKSFGTLYEAKLRVLAAAEAKFPVKPFTEEDALLADKGRIHTTAVDRYVSVVFVALFVALAILKTS